MNILLRGILVGVLFGFLLAGCASDPAKPRNEAEMFPARNQDSRAGVVVNRGTAPMNFVIYDQANRMVENDYLSGADRVFVSASGQVYPQEWIRLLEKGCYRIEMYPFFLAQRWVPPRKVRIDLPKQTTSVCVGDNPTNQYYGGRHWGWVLYVGMDIPNEATGLPLLQILNPFSLSR